MKIFQFIEKLVVNSREGRAKAQAVGRKFLTAEAWVRAQVSPCRICGGESGTGTSFLRVLWFFPVSIIPPLFHIHSYIIWGMDKGPVRGPVPQRQQSHPIATVTLKQGVTE
jgi:hypothetical protein